STVTLTGLSMSPTNVSINLPGTQQFTVSAVYSDTSTKDVTSSATWSSTDTSKVTIQSAGQSTPGLATAVSPGPVNITASYNGIDAITPFSVINPNAKLTSLNLSAVNPSIAPNTKLQILVLANYDDGSQQEVAPMASWSSSDPSALAVQTTGGTSPGMVTGGGAAGTAVVTATFKGATASTTVSVSNAATAIPLMDMNPQQSYLGFSGGLYGGGNNTPPADHDADGVSLATQIQPLDQNGNPSSTGDVVFLALGMSNASIEFSAFQAAAAASNSVNHKTLAIEDGAAGDATACVWTVAQGPTTGTCPAAQGELAQNQYDRVRTQVLAADTKAPSVPAGCGIGAGQPNCLTEAQVQVLWIKNADADPGVGNWNTLCDSFLLSCQNGVNTEALRYELELGNIVRAARSRYPNLKQIFLSSRIYAGYATTLTSPEPYAYEYGYSVQFLISAQIAQKETGNIDDTAGDLDYNSGSAAWLAWGPYLWANGSTPRSDGLSWVPADFQSDGTHPSAQGAQKVVTQLMNFFTTSKYTPWF